MRRSGVTEDVVERHLFNQAEALGAMCIKFKPYRNGWPDRSLYWPNGVHDLIELKRPVGGRYEPLQLRTHDKLRAMGHNVLVLLTKEEVNEYIQTRRSLVGRNRARVVLRDPRGDAVRRRGVA